VEVQNDIDYVTLCLSVWTTVGDGIPRAIGLLNLPSLQHEEKRSRITAQNCCRSQQSSVDTMGLLLQHRMLLLHPLVLPPLCPPIISIFIRCT